jgi:RND family efflux transporter MFP subunit
MRDGQAMFRVVAIDPIRFKASVPERFASAVAVGQSCSVHVEAYDAPFVGQVARIAPRVDDRSRAFDVEILLPNADGRLKPGSFARGAIAVRREENVTFVPEAALVTFAGVDRVYSVADGKAREHRVRPGLRIDGLVEVIGKVDADHVIVGGVNGIAPGVPVVVDTAAAK